MSQVNKSLLDQGISIQIAYLHEKWLGLLLPAIKRKLKVGKGGEERSCKVYVQKGGILHNRNVYFFVIYNQPLQPFLPSNSL